ncbi:hypothetical protein HDU67_004307, partial [Dinochytrium kinnereticum]
NGAFGDYPGSFYDTPFLGSAASANRTYVLSPPSGGASVTVTIPWVASRSAGDTFTSGADYFQKFCSLEGGAAPAQPEGSVSRRSGATKPSFADFYKPVPANTFTKASEIAASIPLNPEAIRPFAQAQAAKFGPLGMGVKRAPFDVAKPLVGDNFGAFYLLDDGETGVWSFATLSPPGQFEEIAAGWLGTIVGGLRGLEEQGAKRLIIDVSANGGGYACISNTLVNYLLKDAPIIIDQLRLTKSMRALLKAGFYGPNQSQLLPINSTSILSPTSRKTRGGIDGEFSGFFTFGCEGENPPNALTPLSRGWSGRDIAILSDGGCGSACAVMVRSFRDAHKTRAYVYGGSTSTPYTPSSFEGGIIS